MNSRITKPLLNVGGNFSEISFSEAFALIESKLRNAKPNKTLVATSGNYSNEVLYLLQKFARICLNTNALTSFDYFRRGIDFFSDKNDIVPFAELFLSDCFFCLFDENSEDETLKSVKEIFAKCPETPKFWFNKKDSLQIRDFHAFFRTVNRFIVENGLEKGIYVNGLGKNYLQYKESLLNENVDALLNKNDLQLSDIEDFVSYLLKFESPVFIIWERLLSASAFHEIENLCMLIEIQAKPSSGFLCIKGDLNSQGLYDTGFFADIAPGGRKFDDSSVKLMEEIFRSHICSDSVDVAQKLDNQEFANALIWNASANDIPQEMLKQVEKCEFAVLHTAALSSESQRFNLILPANLPEELSGTFTDSARVPHNFVSDRNEILEFNNLQQISELARRFGSDFSSDKDDIFMEYISFLQAGCNSASRHFFKQ